MKKYALIVSILFIIIIGIVWYVARPRVAVSPVQDLVTLSVGETQTVNGITLRLEDIIQESRCPVDAQCIEAGAIVVRLGMRDAMGEVIRNFPSDEVPYVFSGHQISIVGVAPDVTTARPEILKQEYRITFLVVPENKEINE